MGFYSDQVVGIDLDNPNDSDACDLRVNMRNVGVMVEDSGDVDSTGAPVKRFTAPTWQVLAKFVALLHETEYVNPADDFALSVASIVDSIHEV